MKRTSRFGSVLLAGGGVLLGCSTPAPGVATGPDAGGGNSSAAAGGESSGGIGATAGSGSGAGSGSSGSGMSGGSGSGISGGSDGGVGTDGAADSGVAEADGGWVAQDASASSNEAASPSDAAILGDTALATGPFTCTEVIGLAITNEWWSAGFLNDGVDKTKFEIKWHHQGYVESWADPNSPFWANQGDPQNPDAGAPIQAPCAQGSATPDRILFVAVDFDIVTEDAWVAALNGIISTIKTKYSPNLKRLDLTTLIRCPNDMMCNRNANYGPGANINVPREDCYVPPYVDSAIAKVIAAHSDLVGLGPEPQATMCDPTVNGPHLSPASNTAAAKAMATYYLQHP